MVKSSEVRIKISIIRECTKKMIMIYGGDHDKYGNVNNNETIITQKQIESYLH